MKNTENFETNSNLEDDLLPEYNFDYGKARSNCFAARTDETKVTVTLDSDVAKVFKTSESVNRALRAILSAIPDNQKIL